MKIKTLNFVLINASIIYQKKRLMTQYRSRITKLQFHQKPAEQEKQQVIKITKLATPKNPKSFHTSLPKILKKSL